MKNYWQVKCMVLLGVLLVSCSQEKKVYTDATTVVCEDFQEVLDLKAETVQLDSVLMTPIQMQVYDSILMVMNGRDTKMVHVLDINAKKKRAEHISIGQGPNEMLIPRFVENDGRSVQLSDLQSSVIVKYDFQDFLKEEEPAFVERIRLKKRAFGEVRLLGDNYVSPSRNPSFLLYEFDKRGEVIDSIGRYPEVGWKPTDVEKIDMYAFSFVTNLKDRIAVCYNWTDLIDIYDNTGKLLKRIHGPKHFISKFKEVRDGKVITTMSIKEEKRDAYFAPINMGDEFWVLFSGKSESEEGYSILANQIYVYGWDGAPRKIINLDQGIFSFTVDRKNHKIYGVSDTPEFHVLAFSY